ncbi:hypothetical protein L5515_006614 [Caenorhabditis briggsae]|uniref:Uncharacterized protein n=1 Tax=Caenorhabditis briggsae TaxID=6238 RepID=A0AAE9F0X3_CAEBR|nr:hypothetical protein L5515_006614 [Caenorhabditis briggsae]
MFEDIYFWTKNGRPDTEKNHDRNASCHYLLRKMKTGGVIMKTYHVDPKDPIWDQGFHEKMDGTFFQKDLAPFVKYSLNKKRRWETKGDLNNLKNLQSSYRDMNVVVSDRVWLDMDPYWCFISRENYFHEFFLRFPIRHTYQLDTDNNYRCLSSNSVYGQPLKSLLPQNRFPKKSDLQTNNTFDTPKIAYHIITPPKNYEKLRNEDFRPGRCHHGCCNTLSYLRRNEKMKEDLLTIRYDDFEDFDDTDSSEGNSEDPSNSDSPKEYYNLVDHFVDKRNRKDAGSLNSSSWSVISLDCSQNCIFSIKHF